MDTTPSVLYCVRNNKERKRLQRHTTKRIVVDRPFANAVRSGVAEHTSGSGQAKMF